MDSLAHGLWAAAAAVAVKNLPAKSKRKVNLHTGWFTAWALFPDVLAFGPMVLTGVWLRVTGSGYKPHDGGHIPHIDLGIPLYPAAHSLVTFAIAYVAVAVIMRRQPVNVLGWLFHILIDIPTHSFQYYATRFLWPIADYRFDGIAWWTPWLLVSTYGALLLTYFLLWRRGWLARSRVQAPAAISAADD